MAAAVSNFNPRRSGVPAKTACASLHRGRLNRKKILVYIHQLNSNRYKVRCKQAQHTTLQFPQDERRLHTVTHLLSPPLSHSVLNLRCRPLQWTGIRYLP